jgi:hypothetical protein
MIDTKQQPEYDNAVKLLKDLRDVSDRASARASFEARVRQLRERHTAKSSLMKRLGQAGLVARPRSAT